MLMNAANININNGNNDNMHTANTGRCLDKRPVNKIYSLTNNMARASDKTIKPSHEYSTAAA